MRRPEHQTVGGRACSAPSEAVTTSGVVVLIAGRRARFLPSQAGALYRKGQQQAWELPLTDPDRPLELIIELEGTAGFGSE